MKTCTPSTEIKKPKKFKMTNIPPQVHLNEIIKS